MRSKQSQKWAVVRREVAIYDDEWAREEGSLKYNSWRTAHDERNDEVGVIEEEAGVVVPKWL